MPLPAKLCQGRRRLPVWHTPGQCPRGLQAPWGRCAVPTAHPCPRGTHGPATAPQARGCASVHYSNHFGKSGGLALPGGWQPYIMVLVGKQAHRGLCPGVCPAPVLFGNPVRKASPWGMVGTLPTGYLGAVSGRWSKQMLKLTKRENTRNEALHAVATRHGCRLMGLGYYSNGRFEDGPIPAGAQLSAGGTIGHRWYYYPTKAEASCAQPSHSGLDPASLEAFLKALRGGRSLKKWADEYSK